MNSPIYSMTFIPKKRNFKLYYLAFPKPWKELLIQLQVSAYKKYDPEYYMKLFGLNGSRFSHTKPYRMPYWSSMILGA